LTSLDLQDYEVNQLAESARTAEPEHLLRTSLSLFPAYAGKTPQKDCFLFVKKESQKGAERDAE